ncbi:GNAT family N-acetyltransferase [Vibrio nigripulchritudo]|uniref:GNAT family N-acetyltransferase n=1 Tax=Vibrio nigripulchritudo TaxID=28173 RepID=UPI0003B19C2D|nr:GNAT family N-acetyltransferase [Vibrio nigripulchritudo]CCN70290.1 conserved hypothetical protein [Vibrio nigripulchritudo SFn118]
MSAEVEFKKLSLSENELVETSRLLKLCFPHTNKFSVEYLSWLYKDNPNGIAVGFNAYTNGKIVGHYSCIPMYAVVSGVEHKGLLSLNTATDPGFQGRGLFKKLAVKTYEQAKEESYSFVCGVANGRSTKLFTKLLKFSLVSPLDVKVGFGSYFGTLDGGRVKKECKFYPVWDSEAISWRANNPNNACYGVDLSLKSGKFYTSSQFGFVKNEGYCLFREENKVVVDQAPFSFSSKLTLSLALVPKNTIKNKLFFDIPERFKPSPLNLIYKPLYDSDKLCVELNNTNVLFSFMDFDAY